jgi:c-di-GMP-binding flagellar brake protein YcgR
MSQDKRKNPRIDFFLQVMIMGQPGLQKIKDFSLSGLLIQVKDPSQFKEGDKIDLVMKLPDENDSVRVKARVIRVATEGIGVEFEDVPPKDAMALEYCFHVFKHTVPIPGS